MFSNIRPNLRRLTFACRRCDPTCIFFAKSRNAQCDAQSVSELLAVQLLPFDSTISSESEGSVSLKVGFLLLSLLGHHVVKLLPVVSAAVGTPALWFRDTLNFPSALDPFGASKLGGEMALFVPCCLSLGAQRLGELSDCQGVS